MMWTGTVGTRKKLNSSFGFALSFPLTCLLGPNLPHLQPLSPLLSRSLQMLSLVLQPIPTGPEDRPQVVDCTRIVFCETIG